MSIWLARARKRYRCDVCGKIIEKGGERYCEGYRCLAYIMIDRNICRECYEKMKIEKELKNKDEKRIKIQGWDKARLGMFVEKVKSIYKEEVRCLNEMGNINCRWREYKEDKRFCTPYTVWFDGLEILGEKNTYIHFNFVNCWTGYKLFRIKVTVIMNVEGRNLKEMTESCKNKLIEKYGKPFEVKITEVDEVDEVTREVARENEETGEESRKVYRWVDENDNTLVFIDDLVGFTTIYTEGKLIEIWKSQVKKWKEEREKKMEYKKDIESF